jgi:DNA polymerase-1
LRSKINNFIIDGNNLIYRAHNANFELKTASGKFSGMLYGFVRTLVSLRKKFRDFKFSVVWDNKAKAKFEIQPDYKAGRSFLPSIVWEQVEDIKSFLENTGVDQYEEIGQEADDVIASLSKELKKEGRVYIYTNDKDLLQLVEDGKVIVYKPKVGLTPEKFYDEEAVKVQFGVPASKLGFYRSFDGDDSDNIKGVSRVPRKIVASLVNKYSDIDEVYSNLSTVKLTDFQQKSFEEAKERVKNNSKIIILNTNLNNINKRESSFDKEKINKILEQYEIRSLKADDIVELFSSTFTIKYSDPMESIQLESFNLFN